MLRHFNACFNVLITAFGLSSQTLPWLSTYLQRSPQSGRVISFRPKSSLQSERFLCKSRLIFLPVEAEKTTHRLNFPSLDPVESSLSTTSFRSRNRRRCGRVPPSFYTSISTARLCFCRFSHLHQALFALCILSSKQSCFPFVAIQRLPLEIHGASKNLELSLTGNFVAPGLGINGKVRPFFEDIGACSP